MRFKKIYVEITNCCNFSCSFCFKTKRIKKFVSPDDFSAILFSIKPYTNYIYLHVLGEPLFHPDIQRLLNIAHEMGFFINLTTNGSLITKHKDWLISAPIRQFNISLHDAEENVDESEWVSYWNGLFDFANLKSSDAYFSFRLWNQGVDRSDRFNSLCEEFIERFFNVKLSSFSRNQKLSDHIFLQRSARFSWPGEVDLQHKFRKCYALKDHVAILVDGTVVPCCLDADAEMSLGNIFEQDLLTIIESDRAKAILEGFQKGVAVEPICKNCGFVLP